MHYEVMFIARRFYPTNRKIWQNKNRKCKIVFVLQCEFCQTIFESSGEAQTKEEHHFCSKKCYGLSARRGGIIFKKKTLSILEKINDDPDYYIKIYDKSKKSNNEKYGEDHPMKVKEIKIKNLTSNMKLNFEDFNFYPKVKNIITKFCVYIIHNIKNNKVYIGKSKEINKRWTYHIDSAFSSYSSQVIHSAIRKYGLKNFEFSIVQFFNNELDMDDGEKYWISYYNSNNNEFGYNLSLGGEGTTGYKHTEKTKKTISEKISGKNNKWFGITGEKHPRFGKPGIKGEKHKNSKITQNIANEIRLKYLTIKSSRKVAKLYNISQKTVLNIINKKSWNENE